MNITITDNAAKEVKRIILEMDSYNDQEFKETYLRMRVVGGGCSGYSHKLDLDDVYDEKKDELQEINGVKVVIDKRSLLYLDGATVDYINEISRMGFSVSNPNSKSTCGCGSSFSL